MTRFPTLRFFRGPFRASRWRLDRGARAGDGKTTWPLWILQWPWGVVQIAWKTKA